MNLKEFILILVKLFKLFLYPVLKSLETETLLVLLLTCRIFRFCSRLFHDISIYTETTSSIQGTIIVSVIYNSCVVALPCYRCVCIIFPSGFVLNIACIPAGNV